MDSNKTKKMKFIAMIISLVIAFSWEKVPIIQNSVHSVLDPTAGALLDWNLTVEGSSIETCCKSIIQTNDGGYAIVGMRDGRIWLVKITALSQHSPVLTPLLETIVIVILAITFGIAIVVFILSKSVRRKRGNGSFKFVCYF